MKQKMNLTRYSVCAMLMAAPLGSRAQVVDNALDALSGKTAGVNVTNNGLDRLAMLNSVRVRGTTSIMGGNDPLVIIDGVTSDVVVRMVLVPLSPRCEPTIMARLMRMPAAR